MIKPRINLVDYDEAVPSRTTWLLPLTAVAVKVIMRTVAWKGFFWGHWFAHQKEMTRLGL